MREKLGELLERVLITHSPAGVEDEMNRIVLDYLVGCAAKVQHDAHDNIYVKFDGREPGPSTLVSAHKDENSLIVRKIDPDGRLWVEPIGGIRPVKYGEGPFDLITEYGIIPGILHMGSTHSSALSSRINDIKTKLCTWEMVYIHTKMTGEELANAGAAVGDRVLVGRTRKTPMYLRDEYVAGYALDDKAAVAVLLLVASELAQRAPRHDVYVAITSAEEGGVSGGQFIARTLQPDNMIAVEVGPVAEEYPVEMDQRPIVLFKDGSYHYDPVLSRELIAAGKRRGIDTQRAVIRSFGSDSSFAAKEGFVGRAGCVCFPTENTHGYEVTSLGALENCIKLLVEHLGNPLF